MEFLGVGPGELVVILVLALIVLGPRDLEKAGRQIGAFVRQFIKSPEWRAAQKASDEIRDLPTRFIREANDDLQEVGREVQRTTRELDDAIQSTGQDLREEHRIAPVPGPVPAKPADSPSGPVLIPQRRYARPPSGPEMD